MKLNRVHLSALLILGAPISMAQAADVTMPPAQGPGAQSARDAREPQVLAACKHPAPSRQGPGQAAGFKPLTGEAQEYSVSAIPGVVASGVRWKSLWSVQGNNADGIVATDQGTLLIAQNNNSDVVELDGNGTTHVLFRDTNTGGALSLSKKGGLFIVERGLYSSVWQLRPQRKLLADRYQGDPLDCLGSVINDLSADSRGGVYFTDGGLFYLDAHGVITQYGENLATNGIILSADEKTLYVTNRDSLVAFDVRPDGALTGQREIARLPGSGDGSTIDGQGRVYVTARGKDGIDGVAVISATGESLGIIPTPYPVISVAFGGPDKKTLYAVAETGKSPAQAAAILSLPMITAGYTGRAK